MYGGRSPEACRPEALRPPAAQGLHYRVDPSSRRWTEPVSRRSGRVAGGRCGRRLSIKRARCCTGRIYEWAWPDSDISRLFPCCAAWGLNRPRGRPSADADMGLIEGSSRAWSHRSCFAAMGEGYTRDRLSCGGSPDVVHLPPTHLPSSPVLAKSNCPALGAAAAAPLVLGRPPLASPRGRSASAFAAVHHRDRIPMALCPARCRRHDPAGCIPSPPSLPVACPAACPSVSANLSSLAGRRCGGLAELVARRESRSTLGFCQIAQVICLGASAESSRPHTVVRRSCASGPVGAVLESISAAGVRTDLTSGPDEVRTRGCTPMLPTLSGWSSPLVREWFRVFYCAKYDYSLSWLAVGFRVNPCVARHPAPPALGVRHGE